MTSLAKFDEYLTNPNIWERVVDEPLEYWICKEDVQYQILIDHDEDTFEYNENWVKDFAKNKGSAQQRTVRQKIAGITINKLYFIVTDAGGQSFVPQPEGPIDKPYWSKSSKIFKIAQIISSFSTALDLHDFAKQAGIEIRD